MVNGNNRANPALFKDGLNFDGSSLKIIGFCKQCFDKLYTLLK